MLGGGDSFAPPPSFCQVQLQGLGPVNTTNVTPGLFHYCVPHWEQSGLGMRLGTS